MHDMPSSFFCSNVTSHMIVFQVGNGIRLLVSVKLIITWQLWEQAGKRAFIYVAAAL